MKYDEVEMRVEAIGRLDSYGSDPEQAHGLEDQLWHDLLLALKDDQTASSPLRAAMIDLATSCRKDGIRWFS